MRNKQVEFNPYIYTFFQNCAVLAMKYLFLIPKLKKIIVEDFIQMEMLTVIE